MVRFSVDGCNKKMYPFGLHEYTIWIESEKFVEIS